MRFPSSHVFARIRFSPIDVAWATLSPWLALYLRNGQILSIGGANAAAVYCLISLGSSLVAFATFRLYAALPRYLSAHDIGNLTKSVALSGLITCFALFTTTRLDGIPRSTPVIHGLLLWAGLVAFRAVANTADGRRRPAGRSPATSAEHVVLIGLNDLSVFFLKCSEHFAGDGRRVLAVLDAELRWIGRTVRGVGVLGQPRHLDSIVEEFATHGVRTDRVLVAGAPDILSQADLDEISGVCARRNIPLEFLAQPFNPPAGEPIGAPSLSSMGQAAALLEPSRYFRCKRLIDFFVALFLMIALLPLSLLAALLIRVFVGSPTLFWQRRIGRDGRDFDLYKLRTLRPAVDRRGRKVGEAERLARVGRMLRATRVDELPQLVNVLFGDMSLIGPRPLLACDQPASAAGRLMVRPGLTGWAQVNGGNLLTAEEKRALDEWYIGGASLWLDLRIVAMTFRSVTRGDRRDERVLALARAARTEAPPLQATGDFSCVPALTMQAPAVPEMD